MKVVVALCLVVLVGLAAAGPPVVVPTSNRGCIYIMGRCARECPEGTHAFTTGCGYMTPEATCENPHPVEDRRGMICDYSACYCDAPTVRDTAADKCVPLDQCPQKA